MAAYEMRNSDWSSDVCSSDLAWKGRAPANAGAQGVERVARDTGLLLSQEREGLIPNRFPARVGTARIGRESRGMPSMLPTEPNTPPFSTVWKVVHFPLVLLVIGLAFMRSEEHTSELQSLMRTSYDVFCMKKTKKNRTQQT